VSLSPACPCTGTHTRPSSPPGTTSEAVQSSAAVLVIVGVAILAARRLMIPRVRATTSPVDWLALVLLGIIIVTRIIPTIWNMFGSAYDYRTTVRPWFRGLFTGHPDVAAVPHP
jgi:nitrate reductase gamma subunit